MCFLYLKKQQHLKRRKEELNQYYGELSVCKISAYAFDNRRLLTHLLLAQTFTQRKLYCQYNRQITSRAINFQYKYTELNPAFTFATILIRQTITQFCCSVISLFSLKLSKSPLFTLRLHSARDKQLQARSAGSNL